MYGRWQIGRDAAKARESLKQISDDDRAKGRLKRIAAKKFTTCFIFSLAEFENVFGAEIWGHQLPDDQLTPKQRANRERWNHLRTNILNKGHAQSRALLSEIDLHEICYNGYGIKFEGDGNE
jgi:hypothetical protein